MCSVCGSTTSVCFTDRTKLASGPGLFGTSRARFSENATSSPVNGVPSWNVTPSRNLISQVSGSSSFHDTARLGWMRSPEFEFDHALEHVLRRGDVVAEIGELRVERILFGGAADRQLGGPHRFGAG